MRVLGVDPGLTRCGLGIVDIEGRRVNLVSVSVAATPSTWETPARLASIADAVDALLAEFTPDAVAMERVFAQHNVRTVMGTAQASGVVMLAAERAGLPLSLYTPSEVKAAVTGEGRAAKPQVGFMVARILGLTDPPKPADAADALAIAITHGWRGKAQGAATAAQERWAAAEKAANGQAASRQTARRR
ncbi:crossover junction endodeoxyribonuclease RuvC [Demequina sp.]|uniref:crossover junction endodeoxyribonuclease RuvC n=1 Tax=Demequina sp. TaxID=2050685 RepID=UPI003D0B0BCD